MFDMTEEEVIEFIKDFEPDDEFEIKLQYERIDISEGIYIHKTNASKECMLCHCWYFEGNAQFIFLCNPQKSSANVCFMKVLKSTVTKKSYCVFL